MQNTDNHLFPFFYLQSEVYICSFEPLVVLTAIDLVSLLQAAKK